MGNVFSSISDWVTALGKECPARTTIYPEGEPFLVVGHRGAPVFEVENTIASFERALSDGANAIETDVSITCDGHLVLWHDWDPDHPISRFRQEGLEPNVRCTPNVPANGELRRPVCDLTLDQFLSTHGYCDDKGERVEAVIPMLHEFMRWASSKERIETVFLDIKTPCGRIDLVPTLVERIDALIDEMQPRFRLVYETVDREVLAEMKRLRPDWEYTLDVEPVAGIILDPGKFSSVQPALEFGNSYSTPQRPRQNTVAPWTTYRRVIEHDIALLLDGRNGHANGAGNGHARPRLIPFTINEPEEMRCLMRMGVAGMQTDRPDLLRREVDASA